MCVCVAVSASQMLQEGNRLAVQLQTQRLQLDKSKKNYEKAFREAEKV